jgi:hypothetical protein
MPPRAAPRSHFARASRAIEPLRWPCKGARGPHRGRTTPATRHGAPRDGPGLGRALLCAPNAAHSASGPQITRPSPPAPARRRPPLPCSRRPRSWSRRASTAQSPRRRRRRRRPSPRRRRVSGAARRRAARRRGGAAARGRRRAGACSVALALPCPMQPQGLMRRPHAGHHGRQGAAARAGMHGCVDAHSRRRPSRPRRPSPGTDPPGAGSSGGKAGQKKESQLGLSATKADDFTKWYTVRSHPRRRAARAAPRPESTRRRAPSRALPPPQPPTPPTPPHPPAPPAQELVVASELISYYDVSGCYILRPWAFAMWEVVQRWFDDNIKKLGVQVRPARWGRPEGAAHLAARRTAAAGAMRLAGRSSAGQGRGPTPRASCLPQRFWPRPSPALPLPITPLPPPLPPPPRTPTSRCSSRRTCSTPRRTTSRALLPRSRG